MSLADLIDLLRRTERYDTWHVEIDTGDGERYEIVDCRAHPAGSRYVLEVRPIEES